LVEQYKIDLAVYRMEKAKERLHSQRHYLLPEVLLIQLVVHTMLYLPQPDLYWH